MSNVGQVALTVVGAIVGSFFGNPFLGAQIGLLVGTALFPTQLPGVSGPRIEDLATTAAMLGGPVPIIYGTIAVPGTVIFLSCVVEHTTTEEVGGKGGGPEQEVTTYTYFQTIAVGLCEGPITGLLRVWENGELKYDVRERQDDETLDQYAERIEVSSEYGAGFTLYLGDESQLADPTLELTMGVGEVPAFRGLAYIVYPDRQLKDEQARRHPQFRFELFVGESVQEVIPPTVMTGDLDNYQADKLLPDWPRNIYYATDEVGIEGLRVFDTMTNTEIRQQTFEDMLAPVAVTFLYGMTVGPDGFLYFVFSSGGSSGRIVSVDPDTLLVTSSITESLLTTAWERVLVIRWFGTLETADYLFSHSSLNRLAVRRANPVGLATATVAHGLSNGVVAPGPRSGTTSYAYALAWQGALSGIGPDIDVWRLTIREEIGSFGLPEAVEEIVQIATIPLSALDPTCTRLERLTGLVFDETDNCLIFGAEGRDAIDTYPPTVQGFYKYDPESDEIIWRSARLTIDVYDDMTHQSRLRGGTYAVTGGGIATVAVIDTRTGAFTLRDFSDSLPNIFTGQSVYDSAHGTVISYVFGSGPWVIFLDRRLQEPVSISSIISDVCSRCGLDDDEIEVSDLETRYVSGYAITRPSPGRSIIDPLRSVGFFDAFESDGRLQFPTRGGAIALTLTEDDLGAHFADDERPSLVTTSKAQDVELPKRIRLQYIAESRDYDTGEAPSPSRVTSAAVNELDIQLPISITDDQAMQAAEVLWADAWGSRWTHQIALDVAFLGLDPTDVIGVPIDGRIYRTRIVSIDDAAGLLRRMTLVRDDDGRYVSNAVADPPQRPRVNVIAYSSTALLLLDLPALRDADDNAGIYAVAYPSNAARTWSGAVIHRSVDGGASYAQIGSVVSSGIVGQLATALSPGISTTWDYENVIEVDMLAGTLESRTEEAVINGANAAAIGAHGRWEIVQFLSATQVSETRWELSGLLRGRRATEHHIDTSVAGDFFVMLSAGGVVRLPLQLSEVGLARVYRAVTFGTSAAEGTGQSFTGQGEALRPFSPVHVHGERSGGDLIIQWTRRGRLGQELRSGVDIPLSEETEAYEVDILMPGASPETALRTLETTTTSATYTAAEQAADGFAGDDLILVRVYQISATVGRGTPGEGIL